MWYLWHKCIRLQQLVSFTKPVYGFCEGIYQSVALHLSTSMGLFSVDGIDRSVSVTIGVYLPCIDQGIDF